MNIIFKDEMEEARNPANLWSEEAKTIERNISGILGPYGMYKLTGSGSILSSGKDVLDNIELGPMAEPVVGSVNDQYREFGDGTSSLALLLSRLLMKADELSESGVRMPNVISGYRKALDIALNALNEEIDSLDPTDTGTLERVIQHPVSGTTADRESIILTIRDALLFLEDMDEENISIQVEKEGEGAEVIKGIKLDYGRIRDGMPDEVYDVKIALLDRVEPRKTRNSMEIKISGVDSYRAAAGMEMGQMEKFVDRLVEMGVNAVFADGSIDERAAELMERHGIVGFEKVNEDAMKELAASTGAQKTSMDVISGSDLGFAGILDDRESDGCSGGICRS